MREFTIPAVAVSLTLALAASVTFPAGAPAAENKSKFPGSQEARCIDVTDDPAGCQPSTFEVPIAQMPSTRLGRNGQADSFSAECQGLCIVSQRSRFQEWNLSTNRPTSQVPQSAIMGTSPAAGASTPRSGP